jgi:hypothetical protein
MSKYVAIHASTDVSGNKSGVRCKGDACKGGPPEGVQEFEFNTDNLHPVKYPFTIYGMRAAASKRQA